MDEDDAGTAIVFDKGSGMYHARSFGKVFLLSGDDLADLIMAYTETRYTDTVWASEDGGEFYP